MINAYLVKLLGIQWNLSIADTMGLPLSVRIIEASVWHAICNKTPKLTRRLVSLQTSCKLIQHYVILQDIV